MASISAWYDEQRRPAGVLAMVLQTRVVTTAAPPPSVVPTVADQSVQTSMSNGSSFLILSSRTFVAFLLSSSALLFSFISARSNLKWMSLLVVFQGAMLCWFGSRGNMSSLLTLSNSFAILLQQPRNCLCASVDSSLPLRQDSWVLLFRRGLVELLAVRQAGVSSGSRSICSRRQAAVSWLTCLIGGRSAQASRAGTLVTPRQPVFCCASMASRVEGWAWLSQTPEA